jgi:pimeloyl-ACP methyl ester carboxylesterase
VFINSGIIHRVGASRIYVRLARALARRGAATLRFDLSGVGDSSQPEDQLHAPRAEVTQRDIDDALSLLEREGAGPLIVAGLCSGADDALAAIARNARVSGAVLIDPFAFRTRRYFVEYYGTRLLRPSSWWGVVTGKSRAVESLTGALMSRMSRSASPVTEADPGWSTAPSREVYLAHLEALISRGTHLSYVFTGGLPERYGYRDQLFDAFPRLNLREQVAHEYFPDAGHTFRGEMLQQQLEDCILGWYDAHYGASRPQTTSGGAASATTR